MKPNFVNTVIINRAVPGSGKTSLSRRITDAIRSTGLSISNHSTDDFFMKDGRYCFDLTKLSRNHYWNLVGFRQSLLSGTNVVICDNTNLQPWQTVPYTDLARWAGYQIIFLNLTPRELWKHVAAQQVTPEKPDAHNVPEARLVEFIRDFNEYNELLDPTTSIDPTRHHHYRWNQRKLCPEATGPASHFDLDYLVTIAPDEYHEAKTHIGADFLNLIRKSA